MWSAEKCDRSGFDFTLVYNVLLIWMKWYKFLLSHLIKLAAKPNQMQVLTYDN